LQTKTKRRKRRRSSSMPTRLMLQQSLKQSMCTFHFCAREISRFNRRYIIPLTTLPPIFCFLTCSDAPALSTVNDAAAAAALPDPAVTADTNTSNEQWDDEALASATARKAAVASKSNTELLDMKALDLKSNEQDDIAEKLRIEETRAKLAAAKEGMEKEAQRLKEEKEKKEQGTGAGAGTGSGKPRFGAAAAGMAATGGKWVPRHMRTGGGIAPSRLGMGGAFQKLDTQDENLFPDLAAADAILEQKKDKPAYTFAKKTPVGGGATWGSRPKVKLEPKKEEPKPEEPKEEEAPAPTAAPATAPVEAAKSKAPVKPKKKKKKDLSTFKAAS
jgi:hypothetical protein